MKWNRSEFLRFRNAIAGLFDNLQDDVQEMAEAAADEIIRTTLAGIGKDDKPFAPYSPGYKALIEAVGGKSTGVVDLRGVFYPAGKGPRLPRTPGAKRSDAERRLLLRGGGRQAYVRITVGGKSFFAKTKTTRPRTGLIDKNSEMSRDLIKIEATDTGAKIIYVPRNKGYMIEHNKNRVWFTLEKRAVRDAAIYTAKVLLAARIDSIKAKVA